ncbi:MAG: diphthine--ammonia ligase [Cyclobacteriaceae bacterium]
MQPQKIFFNWSSGKDSALALHYLLQEQQFDVRYLLTSVNTHHNRVSMHGLRRELLQKQIESIGIESGTLEVPGQPTNAIYEHLLTKKVQELRYRGFEFAAFGDIFLEDLKRYREKQLDAIGIQCVFPLWKKDTKELINEFLNLGFKAITVCVNGALLDKSFVGRIIDSQFLAQLPKEVDTCGENGEFHTFCFDGPIFSNPINFRVGEIIQREYQDGKSTHRFWFCDLLPE